MRKRHVFWGMAAFGCIFLDSVVEAVPLQKKTDSRRQEDSQSYFKKWLNEDVTYIITAEERKVYEALSTDEEREQFIEQFWFRRDPDPRTANNEFKEEHYRRIAYANERFGSGLPGWLTDRGRIYIIHGEPAEIESHPSGGNYTRPLHEGGGQTSTYPFEIWRYRHIEGIGSDVELEFVDPTLSGEYRLSLNPEEKDALLHVPGAGLTTAEEMGLASKADRPYFSPGNANYPLMATRAKDNPFDRYQTFAQVQAPTSIKYQDLKEIVQVNVTYDNLPFSVGEDYYRLTDEQVLTPITLQLATKELSFKPESGFQVARAAIYGLVTSITNRVVAEFEDDLVLSYAQDQLQEGLKRMAAYQKAISLQAGIRYKLDLVLKDLNSGKVGVVRQALLPPRFAEDKLLLSNVLVSDSIHALDQIPDRDEMFVIGDVKIRPNISGRFPTYSNLGVYFQLYNAGLDQTTLAPSLQVRYKLLKGDEVLLQSVDGAGESIQYASAARTVFIKPLGGDFEPGEYTLEVEVEDRIRKESVQSRSRFRVVENLTDTDE